MPGRERPSVADLYQLYAYTQRFYAVRSVLLYPHAEGLDERRMDVVGVGDSPTGASIDVRYVRLRGIERRESRAQHAQRLAAELTG